MVAAPQYRAAANTAMGWKNSNLRTEMTRLLRRAGVSGWPRLFHSMRASWQTELQREFPLHVVCSWFGNSPRIAQQSYLLVTEDDFAKAAGAKKVLVEGLDYLWFGEVARQRAFEPDFVYSSMGDRIEKLFYGLDDVVGNHFCLKGFLSNK